MTYLFLFKAKIGIVRFGLCHSDRETFGERMAEWQELEKERLQVGVNISSLRYKKTTAEQDPCVI